MKSNLWVFVVDIHYPTYDKPTARALFDFLKRNKVSGFIFGGDQHNNDGISHHNKSKPLFREKAAFRRETEGFEREILTPVEKLLPRDAKRVWILGNHERFCDDVGEQQPELAGALDRVELYHLRDRGFEIVELGHAYKHRKLTFMHGEWISGGVNPSKKLAEIVAANVVAGHTHSPQSYTRISPVSQRDKWMSWISPILGTCNPAYIRNRPTSWVNGFCLIEFHPNGNFNCYPVVVSNGQFAWGGEIFGTRTRKAA